jgi:putative DNA primase/helicase
MPTNKPKIVAVEFTSKGIIAVYDDRHKSRIGDPIRVKALGTCIQDGAAYTVLQFLDRDRKWRIAPVRSSLLTAKTTDFKAELTDRHHYKLPGRQYVAAVIDALAAKNPERRIAVTMVPGWHGPNRYVHPHGNIKREGDDWECLLAHSPNVRLAEFRCSGTLDEWKTNVAQDCIASSRLLLAVGASFAAPILRRVGIDTFGLHFMGTTSSGKSLCLRVGASVPGFNSQAGTTTWDGTSTGFEQLVLGTRDNITLLDETDLQEGGERRRYEVTSLTVFRLSKNQSKLRAGHYESKHALRSDHRNMILSSGEDALIPRRRVRGLDVRMIHIPACISKFEDIFDSNYAARIVGRTMGQRERFVAAHESATLKYQGVAHRVFLRRLIAHDSADKTLKAYMEEFMSKARLAQERKIFFRMRRRIATIYAGTALAVDYGILPFNKGVALRAIRKCMNDAIAFLIENETQLHDSAASHLSDDQLVADFCTRLRTAAFLKIGRYSDRKTSVTVREIEAADGFIKFDEPGKVRTMLRTEIVEAWYPDQALRNRLVNLLRGRNIFRSGRQADTASRQTMIKPYEKRIAHYSLSLAALNLRLNDLRLT